MKAILPLLLISLVAWGCETQVTSFEECVDAGYPVMESYPRQCQTPDGRTFIEDVEDFSGSEVTSGDDPQPGSTVHDLPVPDAVDTVRVEVAQRFNIERRQVLVLESYEREWSDSCLGLGRENESCLQVITPGYWVKVRAQGQELTFRTNEDGGVIREE